MQLTIKTSVQKEVEKKITLPSFWKRNGLSDYIAAIDEKTCIKVYASSDGEYISMQHGTCKFFASDIAEADAKFIPVTEQEFLSVYDDAHEAIRMKPMLIDTGSEQAYRDLQKQNF